MLNSILSDRMKHMSDVRWLSLFKTAHKQWIFTGIFNLLHSFCDISEWDFQDYKEQSLWSTCILLCRWHWNCNQQKLSKTNLQQTSESSQSSWSLKSHKCHTIWHSQDRSSALHSKTETQKKKISSEDSHHNQKTQNQLQSESNQMTRNLTELQTHLQNTFSEANSESQNDKNKNSCALL